MQFVDFTHMHQVMCLAMKRPCCKRPSGRVRDNDNTTCRAHASKSVRHHEGVPGMSAHVTESSYVRERHAYKHVSKQMLNQPTAVIRQMALYEFILRLNFTCKYHNGEYDIGHAHWMGHLASVIITMDDNCLAIMNCDVYIQVAYFAGEHAFAMSNAKTLGAAHAPRRTIARNQRDIDT